MARSDRASSGDRRSFLKLAGTAGLWAAAGPSAAADRPNLLMVIVDQERRSRHGLPIELPNRDLLRRHAVEFDQAYCAYPLCSPSRGAILTGQAPHQLGIMTNIDFAARNPSLDPQVPNLASVLAGHGYQTAYFGKWHLTRGTDPEHQLRRYGFDHADLSNQLYALGSDPRFADKAARWIKRNATRHEPWFMVFAPINPHDICFPFLDRAYHAPVREVQLPPNYQPEFAPEIDSIQERPRGYAILKSLEPPEGDEESWRRYLSFYCYLVEEADRQMGVVLAALDQSGAWDRTVVVFTSDHGEMGASHGMFHKGPSMYEENVNVPLLISDPRRLDGLRRCDGLVSNLDLAPTIAAIAQARWPEPLDGRDLSPLIAGAEDPGAEAVFSEGNPGRLPAWRGLRTGPWKYWRYQTGEEFLFDLGSDPNETRNLAADPGADHARIQVRQLLAEWQARTSDPLAGLFE